MAKKVVHVITGLNDGGAEAVLYRLCNADPLNSHIVVSMMDDGKYGPLLREIGVEVQCLSMQPGRVSLSGIVRLYKLLKTQKPDVVQTWMYHADLIGGVVSRLAGIKNIFWGVHNSILESGKSKKTTIIVAKVCAKLSYFIPKRIIYCAQKSVDVHDAFGYDHDKMVVVNNGYDLSKFYMKGSYSNLLQRELGLSEKTPLIGLVGRYDPYKDHANLLNALRLLKKEKVDFNCVLVGKGVDNSNDTLVNLVNELELNHHVFLLGQRSDVPVVMNSIDLNVLSSTAEAFPNVLCEAMACSTPCVTTEVGDASLIVGDTGWVVEPKNPQALSEAIMNALDEKNNNPKAWQARKQDCRNRIVENFSIDKMVEKYHQTWLI